MDVPLSPLLPGLFPSTNSMIRGSGVLSWLSPKAGLIDCSKPVQATVSFQLKDFCDSGVTDLTTVLRVGFRLSFHAIPNANPNEWIANYVSPVIDQDGMVSEGPELNLEAFEPSNMPPGKGGKDTYSLEKEMRALAFLLQIFQKGSVHYIPLSNLHSRISNSGDQELSRYIGSSSLKRRQFIEDRSYIFHLAENDVVYLQAPEVYQTVTQLAQFLLTHGGVTSSDVLFRYFQTSAAIPLAVRESVQNRRAQFMQFLARHPFAFAPFPSQYYVGVRRNLPFFDYASFIRRVFPNFQSSRSNSRPHLQSSDSFEQSGLATSPAVEVLPSLQSTNPLTGLTNGFGHGVVNGHSGAGHHSALGHPGTLATHHHHHGSSGSLGGLLGAGVGANGSGGAIGGGNGPFMSAGQQQPHSAGVIPTQKPLFSLFEDPLAGMTTSMAPVQHQNGAAATVLRSAVSAAGIVSNGGSSNGSVPGAIATGANIWTYDKDFFDNSKISDLTTSFNNLVALSGQGNGDDSASPPEITRKREFVDRGVQTDESSFDQQSNICIQCAKKCCNKG